ncbi:hypothetical protein IE077_000311 [Cardiosporidium cionae]|uniref:Poly(A) RNA polymerase mitochondrial-like central palm domain-containing protein n=1 Tax=Cardiosporidium cionae TaxID=476202 RepID=A0ABQ7JBB7_9APIC|nr:hypothetical protein IE077_000311 [Cardiosporidium cionae]|eukprot:KAF8821300.1 hypothetical protein IE077_000311 [Cardiosporidium cionae]
METREEMAETNIKASHYCHEKNSFTSNAPSSSRKKDKMASENRDETISSQKRISGTNNTDFWTNKIKQLVSQPKALLPAPPKIEEFSISEAFSIFSNFDVAFSSPTSPVLWTASTESMVLTCLSCIMNKADNISPARSKRICSFLISKCVPTMENPVDALPILKPFVKYKWYIMEYQERITTLLFALSPSIKMELHKKLFTIKNEIPSSSTLLKEKYLQDSIEFNPFFQWLQMVLLNTFGCQGIIFGSLRNGLNLGNSDVDLVVLSPDAQANVLPMLNSEESRKIMQQEGRRLEDSLRRTRKPHHVFLHAYLARSKRAPPVVRGVFSSNEDNTTLYFDVSFNNLLGVINSNLIKAYTSLDPRVQPLICLVKKWASERKFNDASLGYWSSYSWVLAGEERAEKFVIIYFLQNMEEPLLPNLQMPPPFVLEAFNISSPPLELVHSINNIWYFDPISKHPIGQRFLEVPELTNFPKSKEYLSYHWESEAPSTRQEITKTSTSNYKSTSKASSSSSHSLIPIPSSFSHADIWINILYQRYKMAYERLDVRTYYSEKAEAFQGENLRNMEELSSETSSEEEEFSSESSYSSEEYMNMTNFPSGAVSSKEKKSTPLQEFAKEKAEDSVEFLFFKFMEFYTYRFNFSRHLIAIQSSPFLYSKQCFYSWFVGSNTHSTSTTPFWPYQHHLLNSIPPLYSLFFKRLLKDHSSTSYGSCGNSRRTDNIVPNSHPHHVDYVEKSFNKDLETVRKRQHGLNCDRLEILDPFEEFRILFVKTESQQEEILLEMKQAYKACQIRKSIQKDILPFTECLTQEKVPPSHLSHPRGGRRGKNR